MNLAQIILRKLPASRNQLLCSNTVPKSLVSHKSTNKSSSSSSSSTSSSDSDEETSKKKTTSNDAVSRLNMLLQQMVSEDATKKGAGALKLAQPPNKRMQGRKEKEQATEESPEKKVVKAVKEVAESLGGNTKQTESELLMKLLNPVDSQDGTSNSLSDILKGMKIEREAKPQQSKAEQVRNVLQRISSRTRPQDRAAGEQRKPKRVGIVPVVEQSQPQPVDLWGSESLGIFTNPSELKESPQMTTWEKLHQKELKLAVTHPPANYFQQMILWTEQGKFWQFPINNEFGLEEESKVYFADHVFLEEHLEPWCPPRGPLRHFMELVCVGLSKNSYLTVEAKKEHIQWFKNYFDDKKKILEEVGALQGASFQPKAIEK